MKLEEIANQQREIDDSLAQGRQIEGDGVDAKEKVQPEAAIVNALAQVAPGCAHQPGIHLPGILRPDARKLPVLKKLEQLGLYGYVQAAHFVQEESALVRQLNPPALGGMSPGKRPLFVSKELRFDERKRNGRAGDLDPREVGAPGEGMHHLGHDLLTRAALSLNQNRNIGACNPLQLLVGSGHLGRPPKEHLERRQFLKIDCFVLRCQGHFCCDSVKRIDR